jgi:hypothetical protein
MNEKEIRDRLYENFHNKFRSIHLQLDDEGQTELDGIIWELTKDMAKKICALGEL